MSADGLEAELERLYGAPLDAFVRTRDAIATALKKAGDKENAAAVKARSRPSVSAWAVNRLWRVAREPFEALLEAGEELREAQRHALSGGGGDPMKHALAKRRSAVFKLLACAKEELEAGGHAASAQTLQRIESTLHTVATMGERAQLGLLAGDVGDDGIEGLLAAGGADLLAASPRPEKKPVEKTETKHTGGAHPKHRAGPSHPKHATKEEREREKALEKAQARVDAAKDRYEAAAEESRRAKAAEREAEKKKIAGRAEVDAGKEALHAAEQSLRDARLALDAAEKAARITDRDADLTARAVPEAERALERARVERDAATEALRAAKL